MMKINKYISLVILVIAILLAQPLSAQNSFNPNSAYGIGETNLGAQGYNAGMGGVSIGIRSKDFINTENPAAITILDSNVVLYNFALNGKKSIYQATGNKETALNGNIRNLALGLKFARFWGSAICMMPYSSIGYNVYTLQPVEGTNLVEEANYTGEGGINKIQWINAFRVNPKLSVGINASYLFGSITTKQIVNSYAIVKSSSTQKTYFDFGVQYSDKISDKTSFTVGLVYGYKDNLHFRNEKLATLGSTEINSSITGSNQNLPQFFGGGLSVNYNEKITIAADYQLTQWSSLKKDLMNVVYCDVNQIRAGVKVGPLKEITTNYLNRIHYMAGLAISNSYIERSGVNPKNFGITAGLGLPIRQKTLVTLSLEAGKTGTTQKGMVSETYFRLSLGVSWKDFWFVRRKYD